MKKLISNIGFVASCVLLCVMVIGMSPYIILAKIVELVEVEKDIKRAQEAWPEIARRRNEEQAAENERNYQMVLEREGK